MAHAPIPTDTDIRAWVAAKNWQQIAQEADDLRPGDTDSATLSNAAYRAFVSLGREELADAWLARCLQLNPQSSTLWRNQGLRHQQLGDTTAAIEAFEHACMLRPDVASYHHALGAARAQAGEHQAAAAAFQQALAIDPSQKSWWLRLARASLNCDALQDAAQAYRQALAIEEDANSRHAYDELMRQIRSGSRAASAAYYDAVFADSDKYAQDADTSLYAPAWERLVDALHSENVTSVLDLGCGPGQFAEFLARRFPGVAYCGIDFSSVAIGQARRRCPQFQFERRTLPLSHWSDLPAFDAVVCTEVLEHVELDREIIAAIPAGTLLLATVPDYESFGHLRVYKDAAQVTSRYGELLDPLHVEGQALPADKTLWLMHGRRSASAPTWPDAAPAQAALGRVDAAACAVESQLLTDGTRYIQDFLPMFGLPFMTVAESLVATQPHVALRHDVDWSIENALAMASLEHEAGVRSSYYLLHPDGDIQPRNYFGHIEGQRLHIAPQLFEGAKRLLDLGHEVGLHNDLISLSLRTGVPPRDYLEQILEAFRKAGIEITGTVAHGSATCRSQGYMNFQIFSDFAPTDIAVDYQDRPELFQYFETACVRANGHAVEKFTLRMADYGLRYEANFTPRDLYVSDSSSRWTFWQGLLVTRFDKYTPRSEWVPQLKSALAGLPARPRVQALVHACHWGVVSQFNAGALPPARQQRDRAAAATTRECMGERLSALSNVVASRPSHRFEAYDQQYARNAQLYSVAPSVRQFAIWLANNRARTATSVLELGCGQGDFLALMIDCLTRAHAGGSSPVPKVRGLGVDGSVSAILGCAWRYADIQWACEGLEAFAATHDQLLTHSAEAAPRWDLVLDKTGTIFIPDPDSAQTFLSNLSSVMAPNGLYVYVASRHYYHEVLRKKNQAAWPMDWLTLVGETFDPVDAQDDDLPGLKGYLKRVFRKRAT